MKSEPEFDVIIIGGSYAGLSAAMALGRSIRTVLIIDDGQPCNKQTPHSHNLITQDGETPAAIAEKARQQVLAYPTVQLKEGLVVSVTGVSNQFEVVTGANQRFTARKILFATGLRDQLPSLPGFSDCWGISVIHCPFCHGYEYRDQRTGILMNGDAGVEMSLFIRNWSPNLTLFTNGKSTLTEEQHQQLTDRSIPIVEKEIQQIRHEGGYVNALVFADGTEQSLDALYARPPFEQQTDIPKRLGCTFTEQGLIQVDDLSRTTVPGVYAAGDNSTMMRAVAAAIAAGTKAGAMLSRELILSR
ncbi:NAD(P)/FAD-dependent oxidoreductase [Spirosoma foliorum]|uniref:NAD(P)/FAD-dependent oxidoreductase n=1 Tax=Spirosoma foliorum TaxID=2710596 RepID=A0A7G5H2Z2_9BACT|nr:NAD(P)/FAD-dependent oxidoreductase [Spirosoma foliorum]QMW05484.1 NAD(P)/FAD-dependent oxidoreductase [Spirosoma foliorum]